MSRRDERGWTPEQVEGLRERPAFQSFADKILDHARRDPGHFEDQVEMLLDVLEMHTQPDYPIEWRRPWVDQLIRNGGTADHVARFERAFFMPWLTTAQLLRFKQELVEIVRGSSAPGGGGPLGRFLADACDVSPGATCRPADLFDHYKTWAASAGADPLGKRQFYRQLQGAAPSVRRGRPRDSDGRQSPVELFVGIGIKKNS